MKTTYADITERIEFDVVGTITASAAPTLYVDGSASAVAVTLNVATAGRATLTHSTAGRGPGDVLTYVGGSVTVGGTAYPIVVEPRFVDAPAYTRVASGETVPADLVSVGGDAAKANGLGAMGAAYVDVGAIGANLVSVEGQAGTAVTLTPDERGTLRDAIWAATTRTLTAIADSAGVGTLLGRIASALTIAGGKVAATVASGDLADVPTARAAKLDNLDAAVSSRSTYAGGAVASVAGSVGSVASPVTVGTNQDKAGYALAAAYDAATTAASQESVNAIPTTPLLSADARLPTAGVLARATDVAPSIAFAPVINPTAVTVSGGYLQSDRDSAAARGLTLGGLAGKFAGITSLAAWLRAAFRKSTPDPSAIAEINDGGGTFAPATDAIESIADRPTGGGDTRNFDDTELTVA